MSDPVNDGEVTRVQKTLTLAPPTPMEDPWQYGPNIEETARRLIDQYNMEAKHFRLAFFWKQRGGRSKGRNKLGDVKLEKGADKVLTKLDAVLWLAADHFENEPVERITAEIYHLLCHIGSHEETGEIVLLPHDFDGFLDELVNFGAYTQPLAQAKAFFEQAKLPMFTIN